MDSTLESMLRMLEEDNESFLGEEIDREKEDRIREIGERCEQIAERDRFAKATVFPISERSKNAMVSLESIGFIFERKTLDTLAEILMLADDVSFAEVDGKMRICFGVHDMWKKHGSINDPGRDPDEWYGRFRLISGGQGKGSELHRRF